MNRKLIAAIVLILAACLAVYFYAEWEKARFDASLSKLSKPITFDEIEISDHDAKVIDFFEEHNPEWAAWKKKKLVHEAEYEALNKELDALFPFPLRLDTVATTVATVEKVEAFRKSLSGKEKRAFHKKGEVLRRRLETWMETQKTIDAEEPD